MSRQWLSGLDRAKLGFVAIWENADGETLVLHATGTAKVALARMCNGIAGLDPTFRLICYSTVDTIFTDLQGTRVDGDGNLLPQRLPEHRALSAAGRLDMLHPRLLQ